MRAVPEFSTARLVLRPIRNGDEQDILAYRGLPDVCRYLPVEPLDETTIAAFVADRQSATWIANDNDRLLLAVTRDGRVIGDVVMRTRRIADRQVELGWVLNPDHHGQGLATEAASELIRVAFDELGMHRVWAQLDPRNVASARLCERLGMRQEALLREDSWFKGEWGDLAIYALLEREWRALGPKVTTDSI